MSTADYENGYRSALFDARACAIRSSDWKDAAERIGALLDEQEARWREVNGLEPKVAVEVSTP